MASAPLLDVLPAETGTDIVVAVTKDPGIVLLDNQKFDAWYDKLKAEAPAEVDITTNKGRDTIRSYAAKVRSEKAAIDKARLRLTSEWRDMTSQANAAGKVIAERLEGLAVEVRAPLTAFEAAEEARINRCKDVISDIHGAAIVTLEDTSETVRERGMRIWAIEIGEDFGSMAQEAEQAKSATVSTLQAALARLKKEESDAAELTRLRAEAAARDEADRIERERAAAEQEAAEETERQRVAAEQARIAAEEARIAAERAEADRIAAAKEEAAQAERDRLRAEHDAEIAAANARTAEAERLRQAEADRVAEIERQRAEQEAKDRAEQQRLADEQAAREANKAHRTRVKTAAKQAIMTCGVSEDAAQKVVLAIIAGEIPAVSLAF